MVEQIREAHDLAFKLAAILEEIKECSIDYDDEEFFEDLYSDADSLQSDLYDKLEELYNK
jgi:hypothetical protein